MREILQQALELLIAYQDHTGDFRIANKCGSTIQALEAELAKPEPVYVMGNYAGEGKVVGASFGLPKGAFEFAPHTGAGEASKIKHSLEPKQDVTLRQELAKPEQEPQMIQIKDGHLSYIKKPWVGLTDEDTANICMQSDFNNWHDEQVIDAVQAKLKELNT